MQKQKHPTRRRVRCSPFQPKTAILLTCDLGGYPPACCSYLLTVFPQWLPFGPALLRFGAALSRTVLSSRSVLFSLPPAEHPGKAQLHILGIRLFRPYHTAAGRKSPLFFAALPARPHRKIRPPGIGGLIGVLNYSASSSSSAAGASRARMDREMRLCSSSISMIFASTS